MEEPNDLNDRGVNLRKRLGIEDPNAVAKKTRFQWDGTDEAVMPLTASSSSNNLSGLGLREKDLKKELDEARRMLATMQSQAVAMRQDYQHILQRQQDLNLEVLRSRQQILRMLVQSEGREARTQSRKQLARNNRILGYQVLERNGMGGVYERWVLGSLPTELQARNLQLLREKEEIDDQIRPAVPKKAVSEVQRDVLTFRRGILEKERRDLNEEFRQYERRKLQHVREQKRIADEDRSPFNSYLVIGPSLQALNASSTWTADSDANADLATLAVPANKLIEGPALGIDESRQYVLLSLLGKGGFSEVYKAYDLVMGRTVAVKIHYMNSQWTAARREDYMRHAIREHRILSRLEHERVVEQLAVFEFAFPNEYGGAPMKALATVLEYCGRGDLDAHLKLHRNLPEEEARLIIRQVLSGLDYLATNSRATIIHYDLKPANILFTSYGGIKITDFGLSKEILSNEHDIELTSQGTGTYYYLPPECFERSDKPPMISPKVDVWSAGIILYQMLYGSKPFGEELTQQALVRHGIISPSVSVSFPVQSAAMPNVPVVSPEAREFITYLLRPDPASRPTAREALQHSFLVPKDRIKE